MRGRGHGVVFVKVNKEEEEKRGEEFSEWVGCFGCFVIS